MRAVQAVCGIDTAELAKSFEALAVKSGTVSPRHAAHFIKAIAADVVKDAKRDKRGFCRTFEKDRQNFENAAEQGSGNDPAANPVIQVPKVPAEIKAQIKNDCIAQWPRNYVMQKGCIDVQTEAYLQVHAG